MKIRLSDIAEHLDAVVERDAAISALGLLSDDKLGLCCVFHDKTYLEDLKQNRSLAAVVTSADLAPLVPETLGLVIADDPTGCFLDIHEAARRVDGFYFTAFASEVDKSASIHPTAFVDANNVRIGRNVIVEPNASILQSTTIGDHTVVRAGAVIGCDGFHIETCAGLPRMVTHTGGVEIGQFVEIQSSTNVARSIFGGVTRIGDHTKIGGQCQIGHAVSIGERCHIRPFTLISGSTFVGNDVWIAAGTRISNSLNIGNDVAIFFAETVTRNLPDGAALGKGRLIDKERALAIIKRSKQSRRND
jgi:UDP-3-O-[3-hydroxymyristoyl] glucosamine N-acyltransferase